MLGPTFENTARRLAGHAMRNGKSRLMIVHENNAAGEIGRNAIQQGAAAAGASVVATAGFEYSQNGIIQAVPGIAAQAKSTGAQAVFLTSDAGGALPLLTQMLSENGGQPGHNAVYRSDALGYSADCGHLAGRAGRLVHDARPCPARAI